MMPAQDFYTQLEDLIKHSSNDPGLHSTAEILRQRGCPSVSIAILDNGKITSHCISTTGYDTETLFQTCSISKPTAGMALMKLIEQRILSLDDKICDVLPENISQHLLRDPTTAPIVRKITLKHLMSHTAGMSQGGFPGYPDKDNVPSASDIVTGGPLVNTLPVKLITLPDLDLMYSGGGITLFQIIMEHATQKSFEEIMTEYVLEPLNMNRSFYTLSENEKNLARCYYNGFIPTEVEWHVLPEQAAAGLWTTPTDLLKLIHAMQKSLDETTENPFMKPDTARSMLTQIKQFIGLTWFASDTQFGHSGGNHPGYRCYAYGYADLPWNKRDGQPSDITQTLSLSSSSIKGTTVKSDHTDINGNPTQLLDKGPSFSGIAIMTSSQVGLSTVNELLHAITYLKGWPQYSELGGVMPMYTPLPTPPSPDPNPSTSTLARRKPIWKEWTKYHWSTVWSLVAVKRSELTTTTSNSTESAGSSDEAEVPALRLSEYDITLPLVLAAIPSKKYADGRTSIELMCAGLKLLFRLDWDEEGEKVVEFWNGGKENRVVLRGSRLASDVDDGVAGSTDEKQKNEGDGEVRVEVELRSGIEQ